eukprot:gene3527-16518_t
MSGTSKKEELWLKRVGKRVQVDGVGFGMLRFFGAAGVDSQCGVELEEPLGAGDGDGYFSCADGHAMFAPMEQCTLVDAEGNPVKAKKKKVAPKKKFESPPSLRKTIRKTGSKTSTPKTGSSTKKRQPTKVDHLKARPKSQLHAGIDAGALEKRNIKRRSPPTVVVAPVAEEAGAPSAIGDAAGGGADAVQRLFEPQFLLLAFRSACAAPLAPQDRVRTTRMADFNHLQNVMRESGAKKKKKKKKKKSVNTSPAASAAASATAPTPKSSTKAGGVKKKSRASGSAPTTSGGSTKMKKKKKKSPSTTKGSAKKKEETAPSDNPEEQTTGKKKKKKEKKKKKTQKKGEHFDDFGDADDAFGGEDFDDGVEMITSTLGGLFSAEAEFDGAGGASKARKSGGEEKRKFCSAYLSLDDLALYIQKTNLTVTIEAKGKDHIDVGQTHRKIGVLLQSSHKYDEAMPFFEKALAIFKNPSCTDGTAVAYDDIIDKMLGLVYDNIATVSSDQGKLGAAKRLHEKSLGHYEAFIEKHADESNGGYADEDDLANCGTAYSNVGLAVSELYHAEGGKVDMLDYAIECHQNALGTYAVAYDGDETEPDIAMVHQRLGRVLRELEGQDRHAEAMESFQKALAIYVEIYGEISAEVGGAHNEIAGLLCDMDKHDEAMATYETALAIMMDVFGEDSDGVAMVYKNMGISEGHREDYPQALALLTKAASIYANIYGDTHPETLGILEQLTSVVIGPSVTTIEESAFSGCKNLTSIVIGSSVKKIGEGAFEYCKNLTSVVFGPSVETIDKSAFGHCKNLPYIDFKNLTPDALDFRSSIKTIEFAAFLGCEALSGTLFIPDSVKKIGNWAFSETGYTDVSMPKIRKCKLIGNPFLGIGGHSNWMSCKSFHISITNVLVVESSLKRLASLQELELFWRLLKGTSPSKVVLLRQGFKNQDALDELLPSGAVVEDGLEMGVIG